VTISIINSAKIEENTRLMFDSGSSFSNKWKKVSKTKKVKKEIEKLLQVKGGKDYENFIENKWEVQIGK
jgi:ABC-type Fe2+-enterobactin transport system substrate-binding protein